ncbi:MAG: hypothetical protein WC890_05510 [Candidatus Margulisiibacteriota bacterium]
MKNKNKKLVFGALFVTCFLLLVTCTANATTTADISKVSIGARAMSMGGAGVAVSGNNPFVNPAVIANTENWELTSLSTKINDSVDYKLLSGSYKTPKGVLGLSYVGAASPAGYNTVDEASLATASAMYYGSSVIALSYGVKLGDLMSTSSNMGNMLVGGNIKYFSQGFSGGSVTDTGSGAGLDLGVLFETNPNFSVGAEVQNLGINSMTWSTNYSESLASVAKLGCAGKVLDGKVLLAGDIESSLSDATPVTAHLGAEWKPIALLALRAGLDQAAVDGSVATNLCAGVGIDYKGFQIDLAYKQDSTLAENSNFYLSFSFSPENTKKIVVAPVEVKPAKKFDYPYQSIKAEPLKTAANPINTRAQEYYRSIGMIK